jgi:C-terminal peptidase prc
MNGTKLGFIIGAVVLALFGAFTVVLGVVVGTVVMINNEVISPNSTASALATRGATPPPVSRAPAGVPAGVIPTPTRVIGFTARPSPAPTATATPEQAVTATPVPTRTPFGTPASTATALATATAIPTIAPTIARPTLTPEPTALIPTASPADTARQLRVFNQLWMLVNSRYVYPDFNGLDWADVKTKTETRIKTGMSDVQFHALMRDLIISLKDDHSSFLSPEARKQEEERFAGTGRYVGIGISTDVNKDKKYIFVLQVVPGGPADKAGIKPHDHILSADGIPLVSNSGELNTRILRGAEGSSITLNIRTPGSSATRDVIVIRRSISTAATIEARMLPISQTDGKKIGYMLVPTFFEERIAQRVRDSLNDLMRQNNGKLDGLIIDIRTNGGGAYSVLASHLSFFSNGNLGGLYDRKNTASPITVKADAIGNSQTVPLAILISQSTASFAEVFSGALQYNKRAILVGQPSAGNIETLRQHAFEDGSVMWIAEQSFKLPNGNNWENKGLTPDVSITKAWDEYTSDTDPVISAAVEALKK